MIRISLFFLAFYLYLKAIITNILSYQLIFTEIVGSNSIYTCHETSYNIHFYWKKQGIQPKYPSYFVLYIFVEYIMWLMIVLHTWPDEDIEFILRKYWI